jgi:hypothetical protein
VRPPAPNRQVVGDERVLQEIGNPPLPLTADQSAGLQPARERILPMTTSVLLVFLIRRHHLSKHTAKIRISREIVGISGVRRMGAFRACPRIIEFKQRGIARPNRKASAETVSHVADP